MGKECRFGAGKTAFLDKQGNRNRPMRNRLQFFSPKSEVRWQERTFDYGHTEGADLQGIRGVSSYLSISKIHGYSPSSLSNFG